jgi:bacterioferritin-associated ferredoxin
VIEGRHIACRSVIHAGPWRADGSLAFQACADGTSRLLSGARPAGVSILKDEQARDEPLTGYGETQAAMVCSCMDVSAADVRAHIAAGTTHVEELKRLTSCGMGPCQGHPCWLRLSALVAEATGLPVTDLPSARPPRRGLTVGQAAGLDGLLECE